MRATRYLPLRDAFDRGSLGIVTKHNQTRSTGALISVVGHITHTELVRHLQETDMASGFANRFLFTCIRRSKLLPTGRELGEDTVAEMARKVRDVVNHAREVGENDGRIDFSFDGIAHWKEVYPKLTADRPGLLGALTARAEAHTVRLALLYALLDKSYTITFEHLTSALAVWAYCDASVQYLFGDKLGDPIADGILSALRGAPDGLTRTEISGIFKRHESASRIAGALEEIERRGLGRPSISETGGRPTETWLAL